MQYVYDHGTQPLAAARNGGAWEYLLPDVLGSVRQIVDASGAIIQSYTYAPFGELLAAQGTRSSALRYTGEQTDKATGRWSYPSACFDLRYSNQRQSEGRSYG